eukprot:CAMPEP_0196811554 /NCGR_PEP_ID=MMETSP1362-20130617/18572_1 /TAXON_ID=163516 /ORGANISM="Leptocylindrus danicus, Strain CCMP1856" /LENGTH=123 /DNA_ID=CAMNT_0042186883 /DNA_START=45 /DNA_END=416 /DNA_ORIENTATION=+
MLSAVSRIAGRHAITSAGSRLAAARSFGAGFPGVPGVVVTPEDKQKLDEAAAKGETLVCVPHIVETLEWTLTSPPPLHQFEEPPVIVETDHLALNPGAEVEDVIAAQGETVTQVLGKDDNPFP